MKATLIRLATGQRALVTEDKALRIHADPYSGAQKAEAWKIISPAQHDALLAEASKKTEVDYDEEQSTQYGRPVWH